jgi:hypothetical protein
MKRFRIGNDIDITWDVKRNGEAVDLSGKSVSLYMTHPKGREVLITNATDMSGSVVTYKLVGLKQTVLGRYTLTIDIRNADGSSRYMIQDKCGAFELVGRSCVEEPEETDYKVSL